MSAFDETPVHRKKSRRGEAAPRWFGEMGQADFEVDFYERILARHPNYVVVLRALGEQLARRRMYARSLEIDRRLVSLVPHDCVARYNLACSLAMQGAAASGDRRVEPGDRIRLRRFRPPRDRPRSGKRPQAPRLSRPAASVRSRELTAMLNIVSQTAEAAEFIRRHWDVPVHAGIILGTGLGSLAREIDTQATLDYADIPHFPRSTAISHAGQLVCGRLAGLPVVAMEGRFHAYEGYSFQQLTFPVRVMRALGARLLIASNACGGMNPQYRKADVMVMDDHINLMGGNPLIGINDDRLGPRFPDMSCPYDPALIERAMEIGRRENFAVHRGVYVAVTGPNLETRAEYRFLRRIGADVVGMSTVPEVLVAVHAGMRVLGLSVVTDICLPDALEAVCIPEILAAAAAAEPKVRKIVLGILAQEAVATVA